MLSVSGLRAGSDSLTVYLLLLEDCRITQDYTLELARLHARFGGPGIGFAGYFPNPISSDSTVAAFQSKYTLPFDCAAGGIDLAQRMGVTVTPEVVLYDETHGHIIYQGRIDDRFVRVGRRRSVVSQHDLADAIAATLAGRRVAVARTQPIGCLLMTH